MAGDDDPRSGGAANEFRGDAHTVLQGRSFGSVTIYNNGPGGGDRPAADPPNPLPPVTSEYANREPEMRRVTAAVNRPRDVGGPAVVIAAGLSGVGKTAMAVRWFHQERERFPGGVLYFDFGPLGRRGLVGQGEVLASLLHQLGISGEHVPGSDENRLAFFRTLMARRKMFVLFDNVRLFAQVADLLPPSEHSVVFITTDGDLAELAGRYDAEVILLRELSEEWSLHLLRSLVGPRRVDDEQAAARGLVRVCGGWPLAIRLAAGRLKTRPRRRIGSLVARLADAHNRPHQVPEGEWAVRVVGDGAYEEMPAALRRAYRLLSLHPSGSDRPTVPKAGPALGPVVAFRLPVAAALLGCDEAAAAELLDPLIDRHLVDEHDDRYTFHELVRVHARSRAEREDSAAERDAAVRRVIECYLREAVVADLAVNSHRPTNGPLYEESRGAASPYGTVKHALDRLESELRNLCAMVYAAEDRGWDELVWQLCEALWGLFFSRKHYDDWIATHRAGLAAAWRLAEPGPLFRMCVQLGRALYEARRFTAAHEVLAEGLTAAHATGEPLNVATALEFIGRTHLDAGEAEQALPYFLQARELEETHDRPRGEAINLHHLGRTYLALGDEAASIEALTRADAIFTAIPDRYNQGRVLLTFGRVHLRAGRADQAKGPLKQALEIMSGQGRTYQVAEVLESLGEFAKLAGDESGERDLRAQAITAYEQVGSPKADELRSARPDQGGAGST
ncbi:MAG: tetratricopeptide repeat protein [Actinomadura sp.]